jgi:hypothetical protein
MITTKQRRNPAKRSPILRSIVRIGLFAGSRGGEALGGDLDVFGARLDVADVLSGRGGKADGGRFVADPLGRRELSVAAAEDRVLARRRS